MANKTKRLARLIRDADKCAGGATAAVQSAIKDIKGRIALATQELNLAGKAADRDKLFAEIHDRISRLEGELTRYLNAAAEMGSTAGFQAGKDETGLQVKYSAERANAILETVTERNGGELAATFTQNMENEIVGALRTATVEAIRAQAITGGTLKGMSKDLAQRMKDAARDFTFTDSRGRKWDSAAYFQMNTRTNAMRIYNDTLADTIARATGSDLARISGGGDPNCKHCFPWEGRVISLTGKTPGFPTYEDARAAGCFHPNCVHTLEYLDETADADEIALQKQFPPERDEEGEITADAADENRYEIDIARKMADNPELDATAAKVLVDRDNLAASIRNGAIRADAEKIVAGLTDAQVAALCPDGNPPAFMAAKDNPDKGAEGWNKGSFGGKVYISGQTSGLTAQRLVEITGINAGKDPTPPQNADNLATKAAKAAEKPTPQPAKNKEPEPKKETEVEAAEKQVKALSAEVKQAEGAADKLQSSLAEKKTELLMLQAGYQRGMPKTVDFAVDNTNPHRGDKLYNGNCSRCVVAYEMIRRGWICEAAPRPKNYAKDDLSYFSQYQRMFEGAEKLPWRNMRTIQKQMAEWGDGARAVISIVWRGGKGNGHFFTCEQINGQTVFIDPQSHKQGEAAENHFNLCVTRGIKTRNNCFMRVDNLPLSADGVGLLQKRKPT